MTKSKLIASLSCKLTSLPSKDVEMAINCIVNQMREVLSTNTRIEIRGFGSFSLHRRKPRIGRNPKTGETLSLPATYIPHFKPGKQLRTRANDSRKKCDIKTP